MRTIVLDPYSSRGGEETPGWCVFGRLWGFLGASLERHLGRLGRLYENFLGRHLRRLYENMGRHFERHLGCL